MGKFDLYGNYTMDPLLRSRRELVVQIFGMVDHPEDLELSVATMRIIQDMTAVPFFESLPGSPHKLYTILEEAKALEAVRMAFMNRLEREEDERTRLLSPESIQSLIDSDLGAAYEFGLANIVRLQVLDLFISNAAKPGYNIVHYLLGFDPQKGVKESVLDESVDNCLFLLLDILDYGLGKAASPLICQDHPSLAAKVYELVWSLLHGRNTFKPLSALFGNPASRYFGFVNRHFASVSKGLLDPSDVYLTAYEMRGKAALFLSKAITVIVKGDGTASPSGFADFLL